MSGLLPSSSEPDQPEGDPRVVGVDEEDAEQLLSALGSETARSLFAAIYDDPATPSELADRADTSLQNAQYHLEKLREADLVEVVDTRYSEKGREMSVFGPAGGPVVLFAGSEEQSSGVRTALSSLLGAVGVLAAASLLVQQFVGGGLGALLPGSAAAGGAGGAAQTTTTASGGASIMSQETTTTVAQTMAAQSQPVSAPAAGLPPGVLFFLGGALVLAVVALWWRLGH